MTLDSLPDEVLLDNLLPYLDITSLLNLSQCNRHLASVASDNTFWRRRCRIDYNLPGSVSGRRDGWKELYAGLRRPDVYVWGASSNGRLGIPRNHPSMQTFHASFDGVNLPVRLPLPETVGMVDLQASGYGFVALDTTGKVWVWGTLDGSTFATRSNPNWMHAGAIAEVPREVLLDAKIESIDCGRRHVLLLDQAGVVWELTAWGKAIKRDSGDQLASSTRDPVIQISAGWSHSSTLTNSGKISIWWTNLNGVPLSRLPPAVPAPTDTSIPVTISDEPVEPFIFDPLPSGEKVIKIASGSNFLVALTEEGKVWTAWVGGKEEDIGAMARGSSRKIWEEHPAFSLPPRPAFSSASENKITHISAHFETFFAYAVGSAEDDYATSVVFKGREGQLRNEDADATGGEPEIIPELQGQGVIKVAVGDYHFGALTSKGKLLTWGGYSSGALGLGQTPDVSRPQEVRFDANDDAFDASASKKFCFGVAASGWHTGALLLDLTHSPHS